MKRALFILLAAGLGAAAPRVARAQTPGSEVASNEADALTKKAIDFLRQDRFADAEPLLRHAFALKKSYDIVGNLGLAEAGLGKWRDAAEHLAFTFATFPANGKAKQRDLLREKYTIVRTHVGAVTVNVNVKDAEVLVDGTAIGTAPLLTEVFVEPGAHVVEARAVGHDPARQDANLTAGSTATVQLTLPESKAPLSVPPPDQPVVVAPDRTPRIVLAVTSGALAAVGVAVGAGLTVAANGKSSDAATLRAGLTSCTGVTTGNCAAIVSDGNAQGTLTQGAVAGRSTCSWRSSTREASRRSAAAA